MAQKRPLNICDSCHKSWYPRGQDRSDKCTRCGSTAVRIAEPTEAVAAVPSSPGSGKRPSPAPSSTTPVAVPAAASSAAASASPRSSGLRNFALLIVLAGLSYFGWQYWVGMKQSAAPPAHSLPLP